MKKLTATLALSALFFAIGCNDNDGDHPPVRPTKKVEDMTSQEKIDRIKNSPLPQAEKDRLIQEEEKKAAGGAPAGSK